jgi:hypothetical protein
LTQAAHRESSPRNPQSSVLRLQRRDRAWGDRNRARPAQFYRPTT